MDKPIAHQMEGFGSLKSGPSCIKNCDLLKIVIYYQFDYIFLNLMVNVALIEASLGYSNVEMD